jgi:hypothetical protein
MSGLNINVLAQAHEYYIRQLKLHLTPLIYEGLISLYEDAKRIENDTNEFEGNSLKQFQKLLCDIPSWNQSILEEETKRILNEVDFLMELVAAVFVAHVQILASVKLGGKNSKIKVKIPTSDIFIHAVYCKTAETFYYNPYKFEHYHVRENKEYIKDMINKGIEDTIDDMIPIENIIKEYISNVFTSHTKENPRAVETMDPEPPGTTLNHNDLGLDSFEDLNLNQNQNQNQNQNYTTPLNDDFGTSLGNDFGNTLSAGIGGDDFGEDLSIGKDKGPVKFDFRDDETDIFSSTGGNNDSPFKDTMDDIKDNPVFKPTPSNDPFKSDKSDEDPFKAVDGDDPFKAVSVDDPFKSTDGEDPFKSIDSEDPFKSTDIGEDPFKNDLGFGTGLDEIPNPPELEKDGIFGQKQEELNFFDDIP